MLAAIAAQGFNELAALRREIAASTADPLRKAYRIMECYVRFAEREKGLFNLMVGPRILQRAHKDLTAASSASFDLFASAVCDYARTKGWADKDLNLVVHAAWSVEHGLATLILPNRKIDLRQMIHFSVSLLLSGVAAGPAHLAGITRLTERVK